MTRRKYGNVRFGGFDSKKEAARHAELQLLEKAGAIQGLQRQVTVPLGGPNWPLLGPTGRRLSWRADFVYSENGRVVHEDVKGFLTKEYKLKRAILAAQGIEIRET